MTQDEVLAGVAEVLGRIAKVDPVNVGAEQTSPILASTR